MAKDSRFKFEYRKNASKLHRAVGDLLRSDKNLRLYPSYQEYPVNKVNSRYPTGSHKFDWVIPKLKMVIECHGIQHYKVSTFGAAVEDAIEAFRDGKARDHSKKMAALSAGWRYIVISYKEQNKVTAKLIFDKLKEADIELEAHTLENWEDLSEIPTAHKLAKERQQLKTQELRKKHLESDAHKQQLKRAAEYRKKRYKELKNGTNS